MIIDLMAIVFWVLMVGCAICVILTIGSLIEAENKLWVVLFLVLAICCGFGAGLLNEPVDKSVEIYSLGDQLGVHGTFILGSGSVDSEIVYVGLLKHDENTYEQIIIKGNGPVYLIEDESLIDTGYIKWAEGKYTGDNRFEGGNKLEIHVPKGTIIKSFTINSE